MRIVFEDKEYQYLIECERDDFEADELKEFFSRLLVLGGFSPDVIQVEKPDGQYHYTLIRDDEAIVNRAEFEEFERSKGAVGMQSGGTA